MFSAHQRIIYGYGKAILTDANFIDFSFRHDDNAVGSTSTYTGLINAIGIGATANKDRFHILYGGSEGESSEGNIYVQEKESDTERWGTGVISTVELADGAWHHIALGINQASGATNKLFVDGVEIYSAANSRAWSYTSADGLRIGTVSDSYWARPVVSYQNIRLWKAYPRSAVSWCLSYRPLLWVRTSQPIPISSSARLRRQLHRNITSRRRQR